MKPISPFHKSFIYTHYSSHWIFFNKDTHVAFVETVYLPAQMSMKRKGEHTYSMLYTVSKLLGKIDACLELITLNISKWDSLFHKTKNWLKEPLQKAFLFKLPLFVCTCCCAYLLYYVLLCTVQWVRKIHW